MTHRRSQKAVLLAVVALAALGLAGCAPATAGPARTNSPVVHGPIKHTPKPVVPALDIQAPTPRQNIPCDTLVPPSAVTLYQGPATLVQPAALAAGDLADATNLLPAADYIREAGGIQCIWSSGPVDNYQAYDAPVPSLLEVTVQYDAASVWPMVSQDIGAIGDMGGDCDVDDPGSVCQTEDLVNTTTWIEIYSRHAVGAGEVGDVENAAIAAVKAAGAPAAVPAPQAGTLALGTQCSDLVAPAAVGTAVGTNAPITATVPDQGQAQYALQNWYASQNLLKDHPCVFQSGSTIQANLAWIPGGAWAWAEDKTQALADAPLQTLSLTGLHVNDGAWIRCAAANAACTVDLILGGNWIEATVPATSTAANKRTAATAVAQAIVTKLG